MSAPGDKWPVRAHPEGHGRWGFVAGPSSGTGYPSKAAALEAGEAARAKAIAKADSASAPVDVLAVMDDCIDNYEYDAPGYANGIREARAAVADLVAALRRCRPRLMHDDRQQEVVCIAPADWDRIRAALALVGGGGVSGNLYDKEHVHIGEILSMAMSMSVVMVRKNAGPILAWRSGAGKFEFFLRQRDALDRTLSMMPVREGSPLCAGYSGPMSKRSLLLRRQAKRKGRPGWKRGGR